LEESGTDGQRLTTPTSTRGFSRKRSSRV
jgi:hypothetical protein